MSAPLAEREAADYQYCIPAINALSVASLYIGLTQHQRQNDISASVLHYRGAGVTREMRSVTYLEKLRTISKIKTKIDC